MRLSLRPLRRLLVVLACSLLLAAAPGEAVGQETFVVNSLSDATDGNSPNGECDAFSAFPGDQCTLPEAIKEADGNSEKTTITFDVSGTISIDNPFTISYPVEINATTVSGYENGDPPPITVDGSIMDGQGLDGFRLLSDAAGSVLRGLAIINMPDDGIDATGVENGVIENCYVGIDASGNAAGNGSQGDSQYGGNGVELKSSIMQVGSVLGTDYRNVISENAQDGIHVDDGRLVISYSYIGTNPEGKFNRGNGRHGIYLASSTSNGLINGVTSNFNGESGVYVGGDDYTVVRSRLLGNRTGIDLVGNGNTAGGPNLGDRFNVVTGSLNAGIRVGDGMTSAANNAIQYNYIGVTSDDNPNGNGVGVFVDSESNDTRIEGNVIGGDPNSPTGSGGTETGITIGATAFGTEIVGNTIGATPGGTNIGPRRNAIVIDSEASMQSEGTKVGLAEPGTGNVIANAGGEAVLMSGQYTEVQNNQIGKKGSAGLGNGGVGILVDESGRGTIGAPGFGNEIVLSGDDGILIRSAFKLDIRGNYIGTAAFGGGLGNDGAGIRIAPSSTQSVTGVTIGYDASATIPDDPEPLSGGLGNRIRYNTLDGVQIAGAGTVEKVTVRGSRIFENGGLGIDLGPDGINGTDAGDGDTGPNNLQNAPEIDDSQTQYNPNTGEVEVRYRVDCDPANCIYDLVVDFYRVDNATSGEGEIYLGTLPYTETDAQNGYVSKTFVPATSVSQTDQIVAVATDAGGNSSEFSGQPAVLPVELAAFRGVARGERVELTWETASETGNAGFAVEHRAPGGAFAEIGYRDGAGTTAEAQRYRFETDALAPGVHAFRLRQVDTDGTVTMLDPITVRVAMGAALVLEAPSPNPVRDRVTLRFGAREPQAVRIDLYDALGRRVRTLFDGPVSAGSMTTRSVALRGLPSGRYFLRLQSPTRTTVRSLSVVR